MRDDPLLEHQRRGAQWARFVNRGLLADEPGLGKTRQAIEAFDGGRNLVVAPALILQSGTWQREIEAWSRHPNRWVLASYTSLNLRERTGGSGNRPIAGRARPEFKGPWDALVLDEAHYIKGRGTNWTATALALGKHSDFALALTGTPISNWAPDVFTTLQLLNPDESGRGGKFGSYWRWVESWFEVSASRFGGEGSREIGELLACERACLRRPADDPCSHYAEFMEANFGPAFLRRLRSDCLDLPSLTVQRVDTPMDGRSAKAYREIKATYATTTEEGLRVEAWSKGSQINTLMRLTTSSSLLAGAGKPTGGKFEMLRNDLSQRTRPTVVFTHYRDSADACVAVAASVGQRARAIHGGVSPVQREQIFREWHAGQIDTLVGTLEVLAEGVTLNEADMAIFVEKSYKPSKNQQGRDRIHRIGQTRPVVIKEYVTPKSVDSAKSELVAVKTDRQMRMLSVRDMLARVDG